MKRTTKEIKTATAIVILALVFLCSFNIIFSYFSSVASINANLNFYSLNVNLFYKETSSSMSSIVNDQIELYPSAYLSRNAVVNLKSTAEAKTNIHSIGVKSSSESCSAYVRFYLEVYRVKEIAGSVYYIDSEGNFVSETGVYVDETGTEIPVGNVTAGEIVDYAEHFVLGSFNNGIFTVTELISRQVNVIDGKNYVTYFLKSALASGAERDLQINAIRMQNTAPNEILDSEIFIYLTMESVQSVNSAYKSVFNDNHGYYNWEN